MTKLSPQGFSAWEKPLVRTGNIGFRICTVLPKSLESPRRIIHSLNHSVTCWPSALMQPTWFYCSLQGIQSVPDRTGGLRVSSPPRCRYYRANPGWPKCQLTSVVTVLYASYRHQTHCNTIEIKHTQEVTRKANAPPALSPLILSHIETRNQVLEHKVQISNWCLGIARSGYSGYSARPWNPREPPSTSLLLGSQGP